MRFTYLNLSRQVSFKQPVKKRRRGKNFSPNSQSTTTKILMLVDIQTAFWNLLATPEAFGSLCVVFICSTSASPPNRTLWQIGHGVAEAPLIIKAACCCKTPRCSWSSYSIGRGVVGREAKLTSYYTQSCKNKIY